MSDSNETRDTPLDAFNPVPARVFQRLSKKSSSSQDCTHVKYCIEILVDQETVQIRYRDTPAWNAGLEREEKDNSVLEPAKFILDLLQSYPYCLSEDFNS